MTAGTILAAWIVASVPAGLFLGRFIRAADSPQHAAKDFGEGRGDTIHSGGNAR